MTGELTIRAALATGKEVIAHTDPLIIAGYKGSGYAIINAATGEGAYKISGGKNGGFTDGSDDVDIGDFLLALVSSLPEKASTAISAALAAIQAYLLFDACDDPYAAIVVGAYVIIATLLSSFILGAAFIALGGGIGILIAVLLIAFIINKLLSKLVEVTTNSPVCRRNG